jgi:2-dehydro-3-deoxyglucarate aldolase/4-hydroxy-2-oxoheptanedioate aldolase
MARASQYGMDATYKFKANGNRLLFVQIEHKEGVQNIEEIVQVTGLDGIIIGPYDLSGSYGKLGQIHDPEILEAIEKVLYTCRQHDKPAGIFAKNGEDAKRYLDQGFQIVATGIDVHYLWTAAKSTLDRLKSGMDERLEISILSPTNL